MTGTRTRRQDESVAVHEAGHAVMVCEKGGTVNYATIAPHGDWQGHVNHAALGPGPSAAVGVAGYIAQQLFGFPPTSSDSDLALIASTPLQADAERYAEGMLFQRSAAVRAIADALLTRRTLTGADVHRLYADHKFHPPVLRRY